MFTAVIQQLEQKQIILIFIRVSFYSRFFQGSMKKYVEIVSDMNYTKQTFKNLKYNIFLKKLAFKVPF